MSENTLDNTGVGEVPVMVDIPLPPPMFIPSTEEKNDKVSPSSEGIPPTVEYSAIFDEFELYENAEDNIKHIDPTFDVDAAPNGVDMALSPTSAYNLAVLAQAKEILTQEELVWMYNAQQAALVSPVDDIANKRLRREGADWRQTIKMGNSIIGLRTPAPKRPRSSGELLTGQDAVTQFMAGTAMGASVTVPLTNTGIWVKLAPAGAHFLAELDRNLAYARLQVGLDTNGVTGTTDDLIFREIINEAALKLVIESNYPVKDAMDLREIIDDEDHKTLSWALAKVIYPKGIKISIPCIDPNCNHVSTFKANPARMHFIDRSKLNDKQIQYLSRGISRPMSSDDVMDYKDQFVKTAKSSKRIMGREFIFRSPTIAEKLQIGRTWLSSVNQAVDTAMATSPDDETKRSQIIHQITSVETVCRYAHYISEIRRYDDTETSDNYFSITSEEDIRNILKTLSTSPDMTDALLMAIDKFLVEIGTTLIGYPNVSCRACHYENVPEKVKQRLILPFDPDTGFFILAQRKISQAGGTAITDLGTFGIGNLVQRVLANAQPVPLG